MSVVLRRRRVSWSGAHTAEAAGEGRRVTRGDLVGPGGPTAKWGGREVDRRGEGI